MSQERDTGRVATQKQTILAVKIRANAPSPPPAAPNRPGFWLHFLLATLANPLKPLMVLWVGVTGLWMGEERADNHIFKAVIGWGLKGDMDALTSCQPGSHRGSLPPARVPVRRLPAPVQKNKQTGDVFSWLTPPSQQPTSKTSEERARGRPEACPSGKVLEGNNPEKAALSSRIFPLLMRLPNWS